MKKMMMGAMVLGLAVVSQAVLIDDFSGDLSNWSSTVILDANGGGANTANWQISGGALQLNTTAYDGIEQSAMIYNGLSLAVGEEVQIDVAHTGVANDIGLYVGGGTLTAGVRSTYVSVYARSTGELFSRGFNGGTELPQVGWISPAYTKLFVARTGTNDYELGYYLADATRSIMVTRTSMTGNDASIVGLYTDARSAGALGNADNLTVIPEPATIGLIGLFGAGVLFVRRRFAI